MSKQFWANLALCLILGSLAIFAAVNFGSALTPRGLLATEYKPSTEAAPLMAQVLLASFEVGESLDRVVEANFTIQNKSGRDVKNIEVMCEFSNDQGGFVDRERWTLFETVPAGQAVLLSQAAKRFVSTRARALTCRITDFQLVKEPFFTLERVAAVGHGAGHGEASRGGHGHAAPAGH